MNPGSSAVASEPAAEKQTVRWLGIWLAMISAVLAFVLASTPTSQDEVWSHLARGRAVVVGQPPPDRNSQLLSPEDQQRAYRTPLYDVALFAGYLLLGCEGLAVLNAAIAALFALVIFRAGRTENSLVPAGLCSILTIVAAAPWFDLAPRMCSYLFLALTVVLVRKASELAHAKGEGRTRWAILVLFAIWANVDRWVVLGPITIGLLALAERYRGRSEVARRLAFLSLEGLLASLLSLNHIRVWDPASTVGLPSLNPRTSPFWGDWYQNSPLAVGVVYLILVLLGLLTFRRDSQRQTRVWLPVWVALLALAVWSPAGAPFFAIVAGAVGAMGLANVYWPLASPVARKSRWIVRQARRVARLFVPVVPVALLAVAWPGWVTGPPYGRPSWSMDLDSSLRDAVWELSRYRREGVFGPESRGLTLSPEVADYWSLFGETPSGGASGREEHADVAKIQTGILGEGNSGTLAANDWRALMRAHKVNHLILHTGSNPRTEQVVSRLSGLPHEWALLYLRGRTVVFGWRDPLSTGATDPFSPLRVVTQHRAFVPTPKDRAPLDGPKRGPSEAEWWRAFVEPPLRSPEEQDETALYLAYFDGHRPLYEARNRETWVGIQHVRLTGNLALSLPTLGCVTVGLGEWAIGVPGDWGTFLAHHDDGPLDALLLAVRSGRRAIAANPDDAKSYFLLGEAYLRLAQATRERAWRYQLPAFDRIRQVQAITAFQQALILRPDSPAAHGRLARLYRDRGSLDLALVHLEKLVEITKARGPQAGEKTETANEALAALEREREALASLVRQRVKTLEVGKESRRVLDLAREAAGVGLPKYALEILLKSDASEFGAEGVQLELDLLLWAGRVRDVRAWLDPGLEKTIGAVTYHEVLACLAAATGHYREVGQEMREVAAALLRVPSRLPTPYTQASYDIARAMFTTTFVGNNPAAATHQSLVREGLFVEVQQIGGSLGREGNALVVAGLLALEAGEVTEAEEFLHRALARWQGPAYGSGEHGIDFAGRPVAQDCLRLIVAGRE